MKNRGLVILCLIASVFLSACKKETDNKNSTTPTDDVAALNSKPQKAYPEFTLEAQKAAMQREEDERLKTRVEGLRDKTPPADWIETAYHGLVVDKNLDVIEMDIETVSKIQESMFSILYEPAREKANKKYDLDLEQLFGNPKHEQKERLVVRSAVLDALLEESDQKLKERYQWRNRLVRSFANRYIVWDKAILTLSPDVMEVLRRLQVRIDWWRVSSEYVKSCRAESVPIPPDWPDSRWLSQGPLSFVFISTTLTAEVFAYKDPAVAGVCYALPRRNSSGSIQLLGIICQSATTGKACFWDNKTAADVPITGANITLDIDTIGNGSTLGETCTECHRGDNVFNIHPGSALDLSRPAAPGGPYDTAAAVRYTPIGQAHWSNPGPLTLTGPPGGQSSCVACHQLPATGTSYCNSVLRMAARNTMPPFGTTRAGWPTGSVPVSSAYTSHIGQLAGMCP